MAVLNGFAQCNNTAQRLLERAKTKDFNWVAQQQIMQEAYEKQLAEQKAMAERQLGHMQAEVERWQERCDQMERLSLSGRR